MTARRRPWAQMTSYLWWRAQANPRAISTGEARARRHPAQWRQLAPVARPGVGAGAGRGSSSGRDLHRQVVVRKRVRTGPPCRSSRSRDGQVPFSSPQRVRNSPRRGLLSGSGRGRHLLGSAGSRRGVVAQLSSTGCSTRNNRADFLSRPGSRSSHVKIVLIAESAGFAGDEGRCRLSRLRTARRVSRHAAGLAAASAGDEPAPQHPVSGSITRYQPFQHLDRSPAVGLAVP
jgi:hypothetical protein